MRKCLLLLLGCFLVLLPSCMAMKESKYQLNTEFSDLPVPNGKGALLYGRVFSDIPLRNLVLTRLDQDSQIQPDFVPDTTRRQKSRSSFQRGDGIFFFANLLPGKYALSKIVCATKRVERGYQQTTNYYNFLILTFKSGSRFVFEVKPGTANYLGTVGFFPLAAKASILNNYPETTFTVVDTLEKGKILVALLKKDGQDTLAQQKMLVREIRDFESYKKWKPFFAAEVFQKDAPADKDTINIE